MVDPDSTFLALLPEGIAPAGMVRTRSALCPEIETYEGLALVPLWEALESAAGSPQEPPYWGWSWPGGQALARYVLDHPESVRGNNVIDLGAGNGLAAVAAASAGARRVLASDVDPIACEMAATVARLNGVVIESSSEDLLCTDPAALSFDVILVGDLFYSEGLARRVERWLRGARRAGLTVLVGEPGRGFALAEGMSELASYRVQVLDELESRSTMQVRVLSMD